MLRCYAPRNDGKRPLADIRLATGERRLHLSAVGEDDQLRAPLITQEAGDVLPVAPSTHEDEGRQVDIHKPKPVHSWREFLSEIGVIVIGVLIALGAEQAVESVRTHEDVRAFRGTIDHEIGLNVFVYQQRQRQYACEQNRIAELKIWLDRARSQAKVPALSPRAPIAFSPYRSAWDSRNAQVFNHLPERLRQKYAEFYDELSNNASIIKDEEAAWKSLTPYTEVGLITLADRRAIAPIVGSLASSNWLLMENLKVSEKIASGLGVKAIEPDNIPPDMLAEVLKHIPDCPSVIAAAAS